MKKTIFIILTTLALWFGLHKAMEASERFNCPDVTITAVGGDTYWGYTEMCTGNRQVVVHLLVNQYGPELQVGTQITLP